jgi:hypothetical protein
VGSPREEIIVRFDRVPRRVGVAAVVAGLALAGLAGCGSHSSSSSTTSARSASSSSTTVPPTAAVAADWTAFFSAKTPVARRVALLQDGTQFASIIKAQADSVLAKGASAKVGKVTVTSSTAATVVYDIVFNGSVALKNQKGGAVAQDGVWKVGVGSFCGLLALENGGKTSSLPAACHSATPSS